MKWNSGVDWLTLVGEDDDLGRQWWSLYTRHEQKQPMFAQSDWTHQGGYKGRSCEGLSWGYSETYGYILRATSSVADDLATHLVSWQRDQYRCTRVDLRVDVSRETSDSGVARRIYDEHKDSKRPSFRLISGSGGRGDTVYVGSQSSEMFARIYDKSAEQGKQAGAIWRYEVVFRKEYAEEVLDDIRVCLLGVKRQECVASLVKTWLESKNVGLGVDVALGKTIKLVNEKTSAEKKLEWLRKGVANTVHQLIDDGYYDEVCQALGVSSIRGKRYNLDE